MTFIDSHCHLESFHRANTLPDVLERARAAGIAEMICVGTSPADWPLYHELAVAHPRRLHYTVGLHPCEVDADWRDALAILPTHFTNALMPVALGEIGLDYFHLPKDPAQAAETKQRQLEAFRMQLRMAVQFECPIVIHSRQAFQDCLREIDASGADWHRVVFHCFSESKEAMRQLNKRGGRGSFTGVLTYTNANSVRDAAIEQGPEKFMLETDSPYLSPHPVRGKPNEPANLRHIATLAAQLFNMTDDTLAQLTTSTTRSFFGLPT